MRGIESPAQTLPANEVGLPRPMKTFRATAGAIVLAGSLAGLVGLTATSANAEELVFDGNFAAACALTVPGSGQFALDAGNRMDTRASGGSGIEVGYETIGSFSIATQGAAVITRDGGSLPENKGSQEVGFNGGNYQSIKSDGQYNTSAAQRSQPLEPAGSGTVLIDFRTNANTDPAGDVVPGVYQAKLTVVCQ